MATATSTDNPAITQDTPVHTPVGKRGRPRAPQTTSYPATTEALPSSYWVNELTGDMRMLPANIDDATRDLGGMDLYEKRMMRDAQVHASVSTREQATLARTVAIRAAVAPDDDDFKVAAKIAKECEEMFRRLKRPFKRTLRALLRGNIVGHKLADLIWVVESRNKGAGPQMFLADIKVKPFNSYRILADQYDNLLFVWPTHLGTPPRGLINSWTPDQRDKLIPMEKFALYIHDPEVEDGSPLGTSVLRPVYNWWWDKQQLRVPFSAFLANSAQPSYKYLQRQGSQWTPPKSSDGTLPTVAQYVVDNLGAIHNGASIFCPDGDDVQPLETKNQGEVFLSANAFYNREIAKGIHGGDLATQEEKHASRATGQVGQDLLDLPVNYDRYMLAFVIEGMMERYVRYNYGADFVRLTPIADLGQFATHDTVLVWQAIAQLTGQGAMYESIRPELYAIAGLPVPKAGEQPISTRQVSGAGGDANPAATPPDGKQPAKQQPAANKRPAQQGQANG